MSEKFSTREMTLGPPSHTLSDTSPTPAGPPEGQSIASVIQVLTPAEAIMPIEVHGADAAVGWGGTGRGGAFYSQSLSRRGPLGKVRLAAYMVKKLSKSETLQINIEKSLGVFGNRVMGSNPNPSTRNSRAKSKDEIKVW
ncbi:hypothetical protein B0H13DRAFT_1875984 [Mycena leptocephala]|nr:hypothetical protein B0H13DRAFT_1875984 [Mycena leptocephala]